MLLRRRALLIRGADLGAAFAGMDGVAVNVETASSLGGNCKLASKPSLIATFLVLIIITIIPLYLLIRVFPATFGASRRLLSPPALSPRCWNPPLPLFPPVTPAFVRPTDACRNSAPIPPSCSPLYPTSCSAFRPPPPRIFTLSPRITRVTPAPSTPTRRCFSPPSSSSPRRSKNFIALSRRASFRFRRAMAARYPWWTQPRPRHRRRCSRVHLAGWPSCDPNYFLLPLPPPLRHRAKGKCRLPRPSSCISNCWPRKRRLIGRWWPRRFFSKTTH